MAIYGSLGKCHKYIARSHDLVHLADALCTVCQSSDRLGTAYLVNLIHTGLICCNQCHRIYLSVLSRRCCHHNAIHARNFRRHYIHQNRRRIYCFAARHINTDSLKWCDLLSQQSAVRLTVKPAVAHLLLVIGTDIDQCLADHIDQLLIHLLICLVNLLLCHTDRLRRDGHTIKLPGILKKCLVFSVFDCI